LKPNRVRPLGEKIVMVKDGNVPKFNGQTVTFETSQHIATLRQP